MVCGTCRMGPVGPPSLPAQGFGDSGSRSAERVFVEGRAPWPAGGAPLIFDFIRLLLKCLSGQRPWLPPQLITGLTRPNLLISVPEILQFLSTPRASYSSYCAR